MGSIQATFTSTDRAFHVEGYEKIDFSLLYVNGAFKPENTEIADSYRQFGRCLMVVDKTVFGLYGEQIRAYFIHHAIDLSVFQVSIKEPDKTLATFELEFRLTGKRKVAKDRLLLPEGRK